jgi:hypothetical protein
VRSLQITVENKSLLPGAATNFLNKKENLIKAQNPYRVLMKINDEL